jgi:hypothetical protein
MARNADWRMRKGRAQSDAESMGQERDIADMCCLSEVCGKVADRRETSHIMTARSRLFAGPIMVAAAWSRPINKNLP